MTATVDRRHRPHNRPHHRPHHRPRHTVSLVAFALTLAFALAGTSARTPEAAQARPAARTAQAAKGCVARSTRDFFKAGTQVSGVGWGEPLEVELRVEVDCGFAAADALQGFAVTETLPAGLTLTPYAEDEEPTAFTATTAVWRFDDLGVESQDTGGSLARRVRYRLRAAPVDPPVTQAGEARLAWPVAFGARLVDAWRPLTAPLDVPLSVFIRRADADCKLSTSRRYTPAVAEPGDTVEVELSLTPHGCWAFPVQTNGMIVLQPPTTFTPLNVERSVTTAGAWYDPPTGPDGIYGIVWNVAPTPAVVPPTRDSNTLTAPIRAWQGQRGGTIAAALRAAVDTIVSQPVAHEIIYLVGNHDTPPSPSSSVAAALKKAADRGIEVVPICVGGGCDAALTWAFEFPDLQQLRTAIILGRVTTEHRGTAAALTSLAIDDALPPNAQLIAGSLQTSVPGPFRADAAGLHIGPLSAAVDRTIEVRYRFKAGALGAVDYVGDGSARLLYNDAYASARLRLPRAPLEVVGAASTAPGCTPPAAKTAWEPSVVRGQDVHVTVAFDTVCANAARKQDLVIIVDSARATTADQLSTIRGAVRNLMFNLDGLDIHAGLVTFDWRVRRVPLSGNLDRVLDRLDDLGDLTGSGFGEPNIAAGLTAAADELSWRRPDAHAGIVLLSNGYGDPAPMLAAAAALKADGVHIASVCFDTACDPALAGAASDPADHHVVQPRQLEALLGALARRYGSIRIDQATLTETLPADMALVEGSADPPPDRVEGQRLTWTVQARTSAADEAVRYAVRPRDVGERRPIGLDADLSFTDQLGRVSSAQLPSPTVTVYPPGQDGPCTPDLRREPRRLDGVVGDPVPYTLSAALVCPPTVAILDVVLVVDHSDSMASQGRLTNAVAAALGFMEHVPAGTRVGLVTFSSDVTAALPLSADFTAVRDTLGRLEANGRTAITRALRAAETLLEERRPDAQGAIVLLTDGREQAGGVPAMRAAATRIKDRGVRIVTVCAGDCDPELAEVASSEADALLVPDSAALVDVFEALATDLGNLQPTDVRITEGYTPDNTPRRGDFIPQPALGDGVAEAIWTFDRLPKGRPQPIQVVLVPKAAGIGETTRFARLSYRFGRQSGYAYFPSGFIDTLVPTATPPPTSTPAPTRPATLTPVPTATPPAWGTPSGERVVWLPWVGR